MTDAVTDNYLHTPDNDIIESMNDEVEVVCPVCSPKIAVPHDVLKGGQNPVVQCQECENVHPTKIEKVKTFNVKVIINKGEESFTQITLLTSEEDVSVDDEIIVDDGESDEVFPVLITAIESGEKRLQKANASEITTIWGRAIDEVVVKIAVHRGRNTEAMHKRVPGGYEFIIGQEETVDKTKIRIKKIKIRDGSLESKTGTAVAAKFIKRVFAEEVQRKSWGDGKTQWSMKGKGRSW
ncbi:HVO_0476 family zinc finger protein [Methanolobus sediminis]|uniref:HVO_0476 family zinc finger protein n=1 Tax=Methanolobus sediminis TaxID=3072978 RepID=A0AA51YK42_9EURY|nr:HVO_0476 family zinc finger protein [Methanolobus sediminis]WMW26276.1 HVO_0476 family zinc finger protein [Methanolobus sediminis]